MKKLFIVVAILLLAGSVLVADANAAAMDEGMTRQVWAQTKARAITSDSSVLFRVWYTGNEVNAAVGVSSDSVMLYEDVTTADYTEVNTSNSSYDTVGEIVDYINSLSGWKAEAGPDGYRAFSVAGSIITADYEAAPRNEPSAVGIKLDTGTAKHILCGVDPETNKFSRLKEFVSRVGGSGLVTIRIYDGDTNVWTRYVTDTNYNSSTAYGSSASTVTFTTAGDKGLSAGMGNNLVVDVARTTVGDATDKLPDCAMSIVYDKF